MPRVKLTEYRAKYILLGDTYHGSSIYGTTVPQLPLGSYVVKVDEGIKKRMKRGLVALDVSPADIASKIAPWKKEGFSHFVAEPFLPHEASEERYLSLERVRNGLRLLYASEGGIDIEEHPEKVQTVLVTESNVEQVAQDLGLPQSFLGLLVRKFEENYFAFLEINPLVVRGDEVFLLDAAVLVDSAALFFTRAWNENDIPKGKTKHSAEKTVEALGATTAASLKLSVINPEGSLFFLLSGGGGSIVIADEAQLHGMGKEIANYGEYSGGPTREETYLYAKEVLGVLLSSSAKKKALVIAGGVANFTDVKATFLGIIDALEEVAPELKKQNTKVFVRRGGPNEKAGLALMQEFLEKHGIFGASAGSDAPITTAIDEAMQYLKS